MRIWELWAGPGMFGVPEPTGALQRGQTPQARLWGCFPAVLGQMKQRQGRAATPGNAGWKFRVDSSLLCWVGGGCRGSPGPRSRVPFPTFPARPWQCPPGTGAVTGPAWPRQALTPPRPPDSGAVPLCCMSLCSGSGTNCSCLLTLPWGNWGTRGGGAPQALGWGSLTGSECPQCHPPVQHHPAARGQRRRSVGRAAAG